ncbi:hypothetical protein [Christiangramia salexigens]|uniref:VWA domain-containing protein n=1 Tax=Christiangramia salexigens TaxID=1913577 RepID=A0A1L3J2W3_9FLAO|nr:hypothetical protein [Christiangramia salexigens]APG59472.1 hypothetical protein LPB144_03185 [Christiangramia salexigens]
MTFVTILYITLALILALGFAFLQYLFRKSFTGKNLILFGLRFLSVFLVLLLLINPKFDSFKTEIQKSDLLVLADNSESIEYLNEGDNARNLSKSLLDDAELQNRFNIQFLPFSNEVESGDSLNFSGVSSDIYAGLRAAEKIQNTDQTAIILISDGNQSIGRDYRYYSVSGQNSVYPVIIGDTSTYQDLSIDRVNSNRYAFLKNKFPVEVFLSSTGKQAISSTLRVSDKAKTVFSQKIEFSEDKNAQVVAFNLPATSLGSKTYQVELESFKGEKNSINNIRNFSIEVIDERSSVLILTEISHPDIGAIKKSIESNEQRNVDIKNVQNNNHELKDYQLVILYQINKRFNELFAEIRNDKINYLIITGLKTDWRYLNSLDLGFSKNAIDQSQEVFPVYNEDFRAFQFEDIGFGDFPPLEDEFGELEVDTNIYTSLLSQKIEGIETGDPLLFITGESYKRGVLLGENIWRWRAQSYLNNRSFVEFDEFFGKLVQNLSSGKSKDRLSFEADQLYYANQNVVINVQYFDENYQFDPNASLSISLTNTETSESFTSDLVLKNKFYEFNGGILEPGDYNFQISNSNKSITRSGSFKVIAFSAEQQFFTANHEAMKQLATGNSTELIYPDKIESLKQNLLNSDKFKPVQKSRQKSLPLIDWYYLLFFLIMILAAEWFYRKYLGFI